MGGGVCYSRISGGSFVDRLTLSLSLTKSKNFQKNFLLYFVILLFFCIFAPDHHYCSKSGFRCSSKLKSSRYILVGI
nr:MAG TPA: hypothetical protein [Caudoviricetes sp.]